MDSFEYTFGNTFRGVEAIKEIPLLLRTEPVWEIQRVFHYYSAHTENSKIASVPPKVFQKRVHEQFRVGHTWSKLKGVGGGLYTYILLN